MAFCDSYCQSCAFFFPNPQNLYFCYILPPADDDKWQQDTEFSFGQHSIHLIFTLLLEKNLTSMKSIFRYLILSTVLLGGCVLSTLYGQSFPVHRTPRTPSMEQQQPTFRSPPKVLWLTDIQHANQLAQQSRRLLFVHFIQDDCPASLRAEKQTFQDSRLIHTLHTQFVPVQINLSQNPMLQSRLNIKTTPTDIVFDTKGTELWRHKTDLNPAALTSMLTSMTTANSNDLNISVGIEFDPTSSLEMIPPGKRSSVVPAGFPMAQYPIVSPSPPVSKPPAPNPTTRTVHGTKCVHQIPFDIVTI